MAGRKSEAVLICPEELSVSRFFVKSPVFPFGKFPEVDPVLGPEMHSTGEVMGIGETFGEAYGKAMIAAGLKLPTKRHSFYQRESRRQRSGSVACAPSGTTGIQAAGDARTQRRGCVKLASKSKKFSRSMKGGPTSWIDQAPRRGADHKHPTWSLSHRDEQEIRRGGFQYNVPCVTTMTGARAIVETIAAQNGHRLPCMSARCRNYTQCVASRRWPEPVRSPLLSNQSTQPFKRAFGSLSRVLSGLSVIGPRSNPHAISSTSADLDTSTELDQVSG